MVFWRLSDLISPLGCYDRLIPMVVGGLNCIILGIPDKGGGRVSRGWIDCVKGEIGDFNQKLSENSDI